MGKEEVIKDTKMKMGEPIVTYLTDNEYNDFYDLASKIMVETKLDKEFSQKVSDTTQIEIFRVLCRNEIEKKLNQNNNE